MLKLLLVLCGLFVFFFFLRPACLAPGETGPVQLFPQGSPVFEFHLIPPQTERFVLVSVLALINKGLFGSSSALSLRLRLAPPAPPYLAAIKHPTSPSGQFYASISTMHDVHRHVVVQVPKGSHQGRNECQMWGNNLLKVGMSEQWLFVIRNVNKSVQKLSSDFSNPPVSAYI